jgi:hypothetical protein
MHRIGGVTLVQPQSEAGWWCWSGLRASDAGSEDGVSVGESTANVDRRKARLERDTDEQNSDRRDSRVGGVDGGLL